jgi:hypothetical protein
VQDENGNQVHGRLNDDGAGERQLTITPRVEVQGCECRVTSIVYELCEFKYLERKDESALLDSWSGSASHAVNAVGFGAYAVRFRGHYVDDEGAERPIHVAVAFRVGPPTPSALSPLYGCNNVDTMCAMLHDTLESHDQFDDEMTFSGDNSGDNETSLIARGWGVANKQRFGTWDDVRFRWMRVAGDFSLTVHLKDAGELPAAVEAGIMVRPSLQTYDRMLFFGRRTSETVLSHRGRPREDVALCPVAGNTDTWFKVVRIDGDILCYTSENADVDEPVWTGPLSACGEGPVGDLPGVVYLGVAAAGVSDPTVLAPTVTFDRLHYTGPGWLDRPAAILNTVFADGNLVANWGFENTPVSFQATEQDGTPVTVRTEATSEDPAYEGRYFCRIDNGATNHRLCSRARLNAYHERPVHGGEPGERETALGLRLEFRYRANSATSFTPRIVFHDIAGSELATQPSLAQATVAAQDAGTWRVYATDQIGRAHV